MDHDKSSSERRKYHRIKKEEPIRYERISFTEDKFISSRVVKAISGNLSAAGLLFITKDPPPLSTMVLLRADFDKIPHYKEIKDQIYMLNDRVLGKVVRIEDEEDGYHVGIAFITKSEKLAQDLHHLIKKVRNRRYFDNLMRLIFTLVVIMGTLAVNLIYMQHRETYRPERAVPLSPSSIGIAYEDVYFKSINDGIALNGWFVPAANAKATILFCHGRAGNISGELDTTNFFHRMGVNLFLFDYRGYGKSLGHPSEQGLYWDARGAYDYLISRKDVNKNKIIVIGESLGGAVATDLALHRIVKALVLESTFVSLEQEARNLYPFLPMEYLIVEDYDALSNIRFIHIPKLIVHGLEDEVIPLKDAQLLYNEASPPKQFLSFEGGHSDGVFKDSEAYKAALNKFFSENKIF